MPFLLVVLSGPVTADEPEPELGLSLADFIRKNMSEKEYAAHRERVGVPFVSDETVSPPAPGTTTISQGQDVPDGFFEEAVKITLIFDDGFETDAFDCSAVVVHEKLVLTAAHCLLPQDESIELIELKVRYGHHEVGKLQDPIVFSEDAIKTYLNSKFLPSALDRGNDIAAIYLNDGFPDDLVKPVLLFGDRTETLPNYSIYTAGWGKTLEPGGSSHKLISAEHLLFAELPLIKENGDRITNKEDVCDIQKQLRKDVIRAGGVDSGGAIGVCPGDSGGGLYAYESSTLDGGGVSSFGLPILVGITSYGRNVSGAVTAADDNFCAHDSSDSNFTGIQAQFDFIQAAIGHFDLPAGALQFDDELEDGMVAKAC